MKIDGALHEVNAVTGLEKIEDLAGKPLDFITRLIRVLEERDALENGTS